ncbi:hypothetical protein [Cutibacterium porci]|nr:hypothetical protein [Cutibacterium porci]
MNTRTTPVVTSISAHRTDGPGASSALIRPVAAEKSGRNGAQQRDQ